MAQLSDAEIEEALRGLDGWERDGDSIVRSVDAPTFMDGIDLVRRVGDAAEHVDHHPDIDIRWRTVTFRLATHSEGGVTGRDVDLAGVIDTLVTALGASAQS